MWAISSFSWPWPVACYGSTPKPSPLEMCSACPNPSITRAVFVVMMMRHEVLGCELSAVQICEFLILRRDAVR